MALPLPGRLRSEVAPLLAVMRHLEPPLADADERIAAVTQTDDRVRWLPSVPNIGPVTAAAFVAALDPAARFRRAHEVEASLGLVPRELSSGETQRCGRMTKAGSSRVRWLLIQAAVSMLRLRDARTAHLREWGDRIAARRGKAIAVVALARRLAGILFALLRDGTVYTSRHRPLAPGPCGSGSWGGRCPSLAGYVAGAGPGAGHPPLEGASVGYRLRGISRRTCPTSSPPGLG